MNLSDSIRAIDVHAHFGKSVDQPCELVNRFMSADAEEVISLAELARIEYTCVAPLSAFFTSQVEDVVAGNLDASRMAAEHKGLLFWTVVNPRMPETFVQASEMLGNPSCVGIKIHPEQHQYMIKDYGKKIFKFAADRSAVVQSHSGDINSQPLDFVRFANDFPEVRLIISHLGHNLDNDATQQVRAIQKSTHGNMLTDTSSSKSIIPNLIEWAVEEIGANKILFGSDSPLYFVPMQRARIDRALISGQDKSLILRENAIRLFSAKLS